MITDDDALKHVSANLIRILEEQGRTAYWLMKAINMSPGALYPIIRGEHLPSLGTAARIAELLDVSVDELIKKPEKTGRKKLAKSA